MTSFTAFLTDQDLSVADESALVADICRPVVRRLFLDENIFAASFGKRIPSARWITHPLVSTYPVVVAYKLQLDIEDGASYRIHLSADERFELFINGRLIARGPERGDPGHWFFDSFEIFFPPGKYVFVARVWSLGEVAPYAQMSIRHGFLLFSEENASGISITTGTAEWKARILNGYDWKEPLPCAQAIGWSQIIHGSKFDWNHEHGSGSEWENTVCGAYADGAEGIGSVARQPSTEPYQRLKPALLPAMREKIVRAGRVRHVSFFEGRPVGLVPIRAKESLHQEHAYWQRLIDGTHKLMIPPLTRRRVIVDLETYHCARPQLVVSGGKNARIEIDWSEALFENIEPPESGNLEAHMWPKGNRNDIEGKFFIWPWSKTDGPGDAFHLDGGTHRSFTTFWWKSGRFIQILVETHSDELVLESFALCETGYPFRIQSDFACSDPNITDLIPLFTRGLQACAHETYMDCPFYEQLMYIGDTRLEILITYVLTRDDRLPRKALSLFDWSRLLSGLAQSQYPSRLCQIIPPFSLWWIAMCHDYALWRGDRDFVKSLLPGVRCICDHFAGLINKSGLIAAPNGWNFTDWAVEWRPDGVPPGASVESSGVINWQAVMAFRMAAELEKWFGESELSSLQHRRAGDLADRTHHYFWSESRGLYADDLAHKHWSEHTQCLAVLSEMAPDSCLPRLQNGLLSAPDLAKVTIYFSHYLFEAYQKLGLIEDLLDRLEDWKQLIRDGLTTPVEQPEPSRSDCHAWGAHPLYHFYATLGGIRPAAPGFSKVDIHSQMGSLRWLQARLPHPKGDIRLEVRDGRAVVSLPAGVELTEKSSRLVEVISEERTSRSA